ncbi:MAG: efflux RND transporter periplasmic adaptor subunit [Planctomycetes bacterium]|nr:efflux RND transporter periplasmic adaptor subunit [Planctomycetota bacterium]
MVKWITFILAAVGLSAGIYTVATAKQELPKPPPSRAPSVNPFARGVAAIGIVEPSTRVVSVVAPDPGMVTAVLVESTQQVKKGQPLFEIDPRPLESQLIEARAAKAVAAAAVERLEASPRPEDIPPLEAALAAAMARAADAKDRLQRTVEAIRNGSGNESEIARREFEVQEADARARTAKADLDRLKAGAWKADLELARSQLAQAAARLESLAVMRDRLTVRSPIDGWVLKRNIEPGEFAMASPQQVTQAALVLGDISVLHVRAQVDEEDVPLVKTGAKAVARLRGGFGHDIPLTMLRIEPLALPKTDILGTPTERVDTRVIEVLFRVETGEKDRRLFPGQAVDVFIESAE